MKSFIFFTSFLSVAVLASAAFNRSGAGQSIAYWGQTTGGKPLEYYCGPGSGIDTIILAYISNFRNNPLKNGTEFQGKIGDSCVINSTMKTNCSALEQGIDYCKGQSRKILLGLGGWDADWYLTSKTGAESVANALWDSWAAFPAADSPYVARPVGYSYVDGWDFNILSDPYDSSQYLGDLVNMLRSNFAKDPNNTYMITGSPQCLLHETNMDLAIRNAKFDNLFVQFVHNPSCSVPLSSENGTESLNYDEWIKYTANTTSADAKLYIGLTADARDNYYLPPENALTLVNTYRNHTRFGGVALWDADLSSLVNVSHHDYGNHSSNYTYGQFIKSNLTDYDQGDPSTPCPVQ